MDELPAFVFLILALAALAIAGGLVIWIVSYISGGGKESSKRRRQPPTDVALTGPETLVPAGEQELLRVSRTKKGELAIFVQGQRYHHLREIKDPQVGQEAIKALKATLAFAEGWLPSPRQAPPHPTSKKSTVDEESFLEQLRRSDLFSLGRPAESSMPESPIPVEEINNLVQKRLQERPDLAGRYVRLTTGVGGSVCIYVGQQIFEAVGDIPDLEVRALIQDAIREWESG